MPCVVLSMPRILRYRVPLLRDLRRSLADRGITLRVVHGEARPDLRLQRDDAWLAWSELLPTRRIPGVGGRLVWLPLSRLDRDVDLFVVPEAAGWLATYALLARRRRRGFRLACWGHGPGADDQAHSPASRAVRAALVRQYDWWFTYTDATARRLASAGVSPHEITTLYNTIDVAGLRDQVLAARRAAGAVREQLRLAGPTALYIGALRQNKGIDVVLAASARVAARVDGFTLIVAGSGQDRQFVERALESAPWLRYVGPAFDEDKAQVLAVADLMLQPVGLGLVVLDAFAAGLPIVTFDRARHGPEQEYLRDGREGVRVPGTDPEDLAEAVISLVGDPAKHQALRKGAWEAGAQHSIRDMARRFADGIEEALR